MIRYNCMSDRVLQQKWLDKEFWGKEDDKTSFIL